MGKIAVIYCSTTGNTEAMANAIAGGIGEADVFEVSTVTADKVTEYEKIAFGSPAMGCEVLEESSFEPFFEEAEGKLSGKKVALFGSYDWGDGQWMRDWEERVTNDGAILFEEGLKINNTPDDEGLELCKEFGKRFAQF
jgi:flavodoxin short chain